MAQDQERTHLLRSLSKESPIPRRGVPAPVASPLLALLMHLVCQVVDIAIPVRKPTPAPSGSVGDRRVPLTADAVAETTASVVVGSTVVCPSNGDVPCTKGVPPPAVKPFVCAGVCSTVDRRSLEDQQMIQCLENRHRALVVLISGCLQCQWLAPKLQDYHI